MRLLVLAMTPLHRAAWLPSQPDSCSPAFLFYRHLPSVVSFPFSAQFLFNPLVFSVIFCLFPSPHYLVANTLIFPIMPHRKNQNFPLEHKDSSFSCHRRYIVLFNNFCPVWPLSLHFRYKVIAKFALNDLNMRENHFFFLLMLFS